MKENYIKILKLAKDLGVTKQTTWNFYFKDITKTFKSPEAVVWPTIPK